MCKKLIKNSQPFGKKLSENRMGGFFLTHCIYLPEEMLLIVPHHSGVPAMAMLGCIACGGYHTNLTD